jgi:hypothetical protein
MSKDNKLIFKRYMHGFLFEYYIIVNSVDELAAFSFTSCVSTSNRSELFANKF